MKKTILLIAGLLLFTSLATGCLGGTEETPTDSQDESMESFTPSTAGEMLDNEVVVKAVQTKSKELCNTLESADQKDNCIIKIDDQIIYESAMANLDLDECDTIQQAGKKEQCEIIVQQEIESSEAEEERLKEIEKIDEVRDAEMDTLDELVTREDLKAGDCEVLKDPEFKAGCIEVAEIMSGS